MSESTEAGWDEYLSTSGSSDLAFELSQSADVATDVATDYSDVSTDLSQPGGDLVVDPYAADAAWDASVNESMAAGSLDSASANQEWADYHGEIATDNYTSAQTYLDAAQTAADSGDSSMAEWNATQADIYLDSGADAAAAASDYSTAVTGDVAEATSYDATAADSYTDAAASYDVTTSYDTTAAVDTTSYDTTSYDTTSE